MIEKKIIKILFDLVFFVGAVVSNIFACPQIDPQSFDSIFHVKQDQYKINMEKDGYIKEGNLYVKYIPMYFPIYPIEQSGINTGKLNFSLERSKDENCEWINYWVCRDRKNLNTLARMQLPRYMKNIGPIESIIYNDTEFVVLYGEINSADHHYGAMIYNAISGKKFRMFKINKFHIDDKDIIFVDGEETPFKKDCYVVFPIGKPPEEVANFIITHYAGVGRFPFSKNNTVEVKNELCDDYFCDGSLGEHIRKERTFDTLDFTRMGIVVKEPYPIVRKRLLKEGWKPINHYPINLYPEILYTNDSGGCWAELRKGKVDLKIGLDKCERALYINTSEVSTPSPTPPKKRSGYSYTIKAGGKVPCDVFIQEDYNSFGLTGKFTSVKKTRNGLTVFEEFEATVWGREPYDRAKSVVVKETGILPTSCIDEESIELYGNHFPRCIWLYNTNNGYIKKTLMFYSTIYGLSLKYTFENVTFLKALEQLRGEDLLK